MKPLGETRKQVIKDITCRNAKRGSIGFPREAFTGKQEPEEVFVVTLRLQEGLLPESSWWQIFHSEIETQEFISNHPIGSEFPDSIVTDLLNHSSLDDWIKAGFLPVSAGDRDLFLPWKVLRDAGISEKSGCHTSQVVLDKLDKERVASLKSKYGENWTCVAEFEYCLKELPHSSPAFIAAACNLCYFVLKDDFKAGYLLRDLEVLAYDVEEVAYKTIETRKKAGASGRIKSMQSRAARRNSLLNAMEATARRNPDIAGLGEKVLVELAAKHATEANPSLWRQGHGQVMEYVGEIRRGEAGDDLRARYHVLFPSKPPKRFK